MERNEYIKNILWDINISVEEAEELLQSKKNSIRGVTVDQLYLRLSSSFNWYTLLKEP